MKKSSLSYRLKSFRRILGSIVPPIHTILGELKGTSENKTIKLLTSTFFAMLLIWFAGSSYGQSFDETKLLAEQGDVTAQLNLGNMHYNGDGVPKNYIEAVKWYRLAAEQADVDAQFSLGYMYDIGAGVPENDLKAYVWYSVSAAQGDELAKLYRDMVSEQLTSGQLARGQEIATKCFESDYQDCE
jgi:hypothetical protein